MFIIFGLIFLLVLSIADTYYFIVELFNKDLEYKNSYDMTQYNGYMQIDSIIFQKMVKIIENYRSEEIDLKELTRFIQQKLNIIHHIHKICFVYDFEDDPAKDYMVEEDKSNFRILINKESANFTPTPVEHSVNASFENELSMKVDKG